MLHIKLYKIPRNIILIKAYFGRKLSQSVCTDITGTLTPMEDSIMM